MALLANLLVKSIKLLFECFTVMYEMTLVTRNEFLFHPQMKCGIQSKANLFF